MIFYLYFKKADEADLAQDHTNTLYTERFIKRKLFVTAVIIMLSVFAFKMHEYAGLCLSVYGRDPEYEITRYASTTLDDDVKMLKTRMHQMCNFRKFWFDAHWYDNGWKTEDMHSDGRSRIVA